MNWKKETDELKKINPKHILFLCVANSARSQMAEGIAKSLAPEHVKISSAGSKPTKVNPQAIKALEEIGIDISLHKSKNIDAINANEVDAVITLCADEICPVFLGKATCLHWALPDPSDDIKSFRKVRDELVKRLDYFFNGPKFNQKDKIKADVKKAYSQIATSAKSCGCSPSCCGQSSVDYKKASMDLGYSQRDIDNIPEGANMGLGCGNPQVFASLKKGETVLDLGSGGGFDCFIAANAVGAKGKVIGIDMTPEMIDLAKQNAKKGKYSNVEFLLGEIEHLPVSDSTIDIIISNCVINLSTDKPKVFKEAFRVLKKGGRLAISDVIKTCKLPTEVEKMTEAYTGCISGASTLEDMKIFLTNAGFKNILLTPKDESREFIKNWLPGSRIEDYVQSVMIKAVKP